MNQLPPGEKPKTPVLLPANVSRSMTLEGQVVAASCPSSEEEEEDEEGRTRRGGVGLMSKQVIRSRTDG